MDSRSGGPFDVELIIFISHVARYGIPFGLVGNLLLFNAKTVGQLMVHRTATKQPVRVTQLHSGWIILRCLNCRRLSTIQIADPLLGPLTKTSKARSRAISHCRKEVSL